MNEESDGHPMQCNTTAVRFHAPLVVVHNFSSFFSFQREKEFEFLSTRRTEMRTIRKKKKKTLNILQKKNQNCCKKQTQAFAILFVDP